MRRTSTALLCAVSLIFAIAPVMEAVAQSPSQRLEKGDSLLEYLKDHSNLHIHGTFRVSPWKEGAVGIYTDSPDSAKDRVKIVLSLGRYPLAVIRDDVEEPYFLIDTNGDGVLNARRKELFIPFWVVFENTSNKTDDEQIVLTMELIYRTYQSDQGPRNHEDMKRAFGVINSYALDEEKENRDLFYMLMFHLLNSRKEPETCLLSMTVLRNQCQERLGKVHLLTFLFLAENLIELERPYEALQYVERLLEQDPDFVPALVYRYQLEQDSAKAAEMLARLKREHGDHWVVKQL